MALLFFLTTVLRPSLSDALHILDWKLPNDPTINAIHLTDQQFAELLEKWVMPSWQANFSTYWVGLYSRMKSKSLTSDEKWRLLSMCNHTKTKWSDMSFRMTPYDCVAGNFGHYHLNQYGESLMPGICREWWNIIFEHGALFPKVTQSQEAVRIITVVSCLLLHAFAVAICCILSARKNQSNLAQRVVDVSSDQSPSIEDDACFGKVPNYIYGLKALSICFVTIYYTTNPMELMVPSPYARFNQPGKLFFGGRGITWVGMTLCLHGYEAGLRLRAFGTCTWTNTRAFYRLCFWKVWPAYHFVWLFFFS